MRSLPNFNFENLDTYTKSLTAIEENIRLLIQYVEECDDNFTDDDRTQLINNIKWLKRYYESAERNILNGN